MTRIDPHNDLDIPTLRSLVKGEEKIGLSANAEKSIRECREFLESKIEQESSPIYGINTGFGALCDTPISNSDLTQLQHNLIMSHACGTGPTVPQELIKGILLLKVQSLAYGHSGIRVEVVQRLIDMFNHGVLPVIFEQGSLGASGDLAPLAHLALPLIGKGELWVHDERMPAEDALEKLGWSPLKLQSKEGLALINGTQFMGAYGVQCLIEGQHLFEMADLIGALSLEAFDCRPEPFDESIQRVRKQPGQKRVSENIRKAIRGSSLTDGPKKNVQDPYSFRCIPQVHGASRDLLDHFKGTVLREINSVTDNPVIFPAEGKILSAGNFHGQPLAMGLDQLSIALAELGSISERRVYRLLSGQRKLPPFLIADPGLQSGFMIPQYTAASIVSQNKQLCMPNSVDTIESSNGQEDHVSMGANAATKALKVLENTKTILSIELFTAAQALDFRDRERTSPTLQKVMDGFRERVPFLEKDEEMHPRIQQSKAWMMEADPSEYFKA